MPSFRVGGIWVLKIEKFLSYALILKSRHNYLMPASKYIL
jgi:hypothetical protein